MMLFNKNNFNINKLIFTKSLYSEHLEKLRKTYLEVKNISKTTKK